MKAAIIAPTIIYFAAAAAVTSAAVVSATNNVRRRTRDLETTEVSMSATFVATWLTKLSGTANRDTPTVVIKCGLPGGSINLVETSSSDVTCSKKTAPAPNDHMEELECTSGDSVFSTLDVTARGRGVSVTFTCTGPSEDDLRASAHIQPQSFTVDVAGKYSGKY